MKSLADLDHEKMPEACDSQQSHHRQLLLHRSAVQILEVGIDNSTLIQIQIEMRLKVSCVQSSLHRQSYVNFSNHQTDRYSFVVCQRQHSSGQHACTEIVFTCNQSAIQCCVFTNLTWKTGHSSCFELNAASSLDTTYNLKDDRMCWLLCYAGSWRIAVSCSSSSCVISNSTNFSAHTFLQPPTAPRGGALISASQIPGCWLVVHPGLGSLTETKCEWPSFGVWRLQMLVRTAFNYTIVQHHKPSSGCPSCCACSTMAWICASYCSTDMSGLGTSALPLLLMRVMTETVKQYAPRGCFWVQRLPYDAERRTLFLFFLKQYASAWQRRQEKVSSSFSNADSSLWYMYGVTVVWAVCSLLKEASAAVSDTAGYAMHAHAG